MIKKGSKAEVIFEKLSGFAGVAKAVGKASKIDKANKAYKAAKPALAHAKKIAPAKGTIKPGPIAKKIGDSIAKKVNGIGKPNAKKTFLTAPKRRFM